MKFDVIISNPPYNRDMYLDFVEAAYDLLNEDGVGVFITPAKFYAKGGSKNEAFRQRIMPHIKNVHLYKCCTDVFNIAEQGGIAYYDFYKSQTLDTKEIYNHNKNASLDDTRLDTHTHTEKPVEFMPLSCLHILNKIKQLNNGHTLLENFDLIDSYYCGQNDYADSDSPCENHYPFYSGVGGRLSLAGYINKSKLKRTTNIEKYKVFMAQNMFTGVGNDSNGYLPYTKLCQILGPNEIPKGHAYIILHFADNETEAKSFCAYVNSQLVSFIAMLTVLGNGTGHVENWRHVPALPTAYPTDLTNVHTDYVKKHAGEPCKFDHIYTNEEIFDIFQLTEDERKLIASVIKPRTKKGR